MERVLFLFLIVCFACREHKDYNEEVYSLCLDEIVISYVDGSGNISDNIQSSISIFINVIDSAKKQQFLNEDNISNTSVGSIFGILRMDTFEKRGYFYLRAKSNNDTISVYTRLNPYVFNNVHEFFNGTKKKIEKNISMDLIFSFNDTLHLEKSIRTKLKFMYNNKPVDMEKDSILLKAIEIGSGQK